MAELSKRARELQQQLSQDLAATADEASLQEVRTKYFGKRGQITALLKQLAQLSPAEKSELGRQLNLLKQQGLQELQHKAAALQQAKLNSELMQEQTDISLPHYGLARGGLHPITTIRRRLEDIFNNAGYETVLGPEVESDYYNFEALNFPPRHPARSLHDTFYFSDGSLLRTHTSTGQVRAMEAATPPFKIICPGKTYRCDYDATHSPMFHQLEGMVVAKGITFTDLKGTLQQFINAFCGEEMEIRFRSSYFPFTEPSAEVDLLWQQADGQTKWLEILGCGMVHPKVLAAGGIDPEEYTGFAFGLGIERMAMLYYGISDLRLFYENDLRFNQQFA